MFQLKRLSENPILTPDQNSVWESVAAFNGSVTERWMKIYMVYRAISSRLAWHGEDMHISTVGLVESYDGIHFKSRRQFIYPIEPWEKFGCEDPRITRLGGKYYIFYTALSGHPFTAEHIKVAVAVSSDLKSVDERHLVTPFNAKAMSLFPDFINGKMAVLFSANTDLPPAKICLAYFNKPQDMWSPEYWQDYQNRLEEFSLPLLRSPADQVEAGAVPVKTKWGWLVIYSYIKNYFAGHRDFGVEAVLLDLKNPRKILGRTQESMLSVKEDYERHGLVPNVVFPTGALVRNGRLYVYYGAADNSIAVAYGYLENLIRNYLLPEPNKFVWVKDFETPKEIVKLERFVGNPILSPVYESVWENKAVFNPAALWLNNRVHLIYRAMSRQDISRLGYASSRDGVTIDERSNFPVYTAVDAEKATHRVVSAEDPRLTRIGDTIYMCYTHFDGRLPRVALTTISVSDFIQHKWHWSLPILISSPNVDDKDACIHPAVLNGEYGIFHRVNNQICLDFVKDFKAKKGVLLKGRSIMNARRERWDNIKIGIASPPVDVGDFWLLLYHGVSEPSNFYKLGAVLLNKEKPWEVVSRLDYPIFEPKTRYERVGQVDNVVFPCGAVVIKDRLLVYYGGGDSVIGAASIKLASLISELKKNLAE